MGLQDRLKVGAEQQQQGESYEDTPLPTALAPATPLRQREGDRRADPYAELKTRIHHACIARLGPELFTSDNGSGDIADRVLRAVMEQLALVRTPLTREERRKLVREIADDILGYGPLEPYLRDTAVT